MKKLLNVMMTHEIIELREILLKSDLMAEIGRYPDMTESHETRESIKNDFLERAIILAKIEKYLRKNG